MVKQSMQEPVHSGLLYGNVIEMDTNLMFQNLLDHNAAKRVEVLIVMRKLLKDGNQLPSFQDAPRNSIFEILFHVLDDTRWEVRYQCLLLICALIPDITDELDSCMSIVLQKVISNLGHENVNVRRASLQVLHNHMKYTDNLQNFQKNFIQYGLENPEYIVRKGCIMSIGILFASGFENENLFPLIECLSKHFVDGDASLFYPIFLAMQKINELVGTSTFEQYLQKLDDEAANTYMRVLNKFTLNGSRMSSSSGSRCSFSNLNGISSMSTNKLLKYDFGIFQPYITEKIKSDDWKTRVEAIEHMKIIIREIPDFSEKISDMDEYMIFLSRLLEDSNFKIVIQALSVYDLLIDKFKNQMKRFLKTFVTSVLKRLGDAKLVVREHAIRVIHKLMHYVKPTDVLGNLLQFKDSRNPRLREEIINRVTGAVLTFPSYNFEFLPLCEAVAPLLADTKRRVRLAALECFAALAQAMGPTRLVPLVTAVDVVEINSDADGLLSAVQSRLARRILPRCTEDGAVSYAIMLPSSAGCQNRNVSSWGADIEWIMAASGSSSSSTPPSRSRDVLVTDIDQNGESSVSKLVEINLSRNENTNIFKRNSNWVNNTVYDGASFPESKSIDQDISIEQSQLTVKEEIKDNKVSPVFGSTSDKTTVPALRETYQETFSMTPHQDSPKTRPVIVNSKIPVLARFPGKKQNPEEIEMPPKTTHLRALSAQRHNTLPSFNARYSASQRRSSSHFSQENRILNMTLDKTNPENVLRKISPSATQIGRQPILVRSPSLSSLGQFQSDVNSGNHVFYGAYSPPAKNMGNISSYFRQSPGGVVVAQPAPVHLDDVNVFGVTVIGDNGKMSSSPSSEGWEILHTASHSDSKSDNWQKSVEGMPEVYEMHVDSPASYGRKIVTSPLNMVDNGNISIAKITREKMLKRQQEIMKEAEEKRLNREREQILLEQKVQEEQIKQNIEKSTSPIPDNVCNELDPQVSEDAVPITVEQPQNENQISVPKPATPDDKQVPTKPTSVVQQYKRLESARSKGSAKPLSRSSSLKTPSTLRKLTQNQSQTRTSQTLKHNLAASSLALFDESSDEVATYPNPNEALKKALKSLATDTWMGKIEGIRTIQRLAKSHSDVLQMQLHPVVLALLTEVKNLRSSVARAAILAIGDLFVALKKNVEPDLDLITSTLLSKCGETVGFIRDDIEKVMSHLIDTITPCKAAVSIIAGGASHRNGAVRKVAAQSLLAVAEKMGAARILTSKDVTERLLPTTALFLMDGMPLTRWYGRRIYQLLMTHPSFDKLLLRYVQPSTLRNINSILDSIRKKGAGDMPKEGVSARTLKNETYRNGHLNRTM